MTAPCAQNGRATGHRWVANILVLLLLVNLHVTAQLAITLVPLPDWSDTAAQAVMNAFGSQDAESLAAYQQGMRESEVQVKEYEERLKEQEKAGGGIETLLLPPSGPYYVPDTRFLGVGVHGLRSFILTWGELFLVGFASWICIDAPRYKTLWASVILSSVLLSPYPGDVGSLLAGCSLEAWRDCAPQVFISRAVNALAAGIGMASGWALLRLLAPLGRST